MIRIYIMHKWDLICNICISDWALFMKSRIILKITKLNELICGVLDK